LHRGDVIGSASLTENIHELMVDNGMINGRQRFQF
jgi:hypothetical protein